MSETERERKDESGAHHLAALIRRSGTVVVDGKHDEHEWQRLRCMARALRTQKGGIAPAGRRWRFLPVGSVAALAVALAVVLWPKPDLVCKVRATGVPATYFVAGKDEPLDLDFSDGSTVHLSAESQLHLPELRSNGAVLDLEHGEVHVAIRHRRETRWQLQAGPYKVKITGTRFRAAWDPLHGALDVDLFEGSVSVLGTNLSAPLPLAVGQHLHATLTGDVVIRSPEEKAPVAAPVDPGPAERPSVEEPRSAPSSHVGEPSPAHEPGCDFSPLLTQGQFQAIVAQARIRGIRAVQTDCAVSELFALSDAARYVGELTLSAEILTAILRRSPEDAARAAFFLGRIEEILGRPRLALKWYALVRASDDVYVAEARAARQRIEGAAALPVRQSAKTAGITRRAHGAHP